MAENESIFIDHSSLDKIKSANVLLKIKSKEYWHKFIIENGALLPRDRVLYSVLNFVDPLFFVPVKFTRSDRDCFFFGRNCGDVIVKLCQSFLKVPFHFGQNDSDPGTEPLSIAMEICCMKSNDFQINMKTILGKSIQNRLSMSKEEEFNLSNFHNEPELREVIFCPLSIEKNFSYVLNMVLSHLKKLKKTKINLSNNYLKNLESLEILEEAEGLTSLDLSNNEIDNTNKLSAVGRSLPSLQEINLSGNPVCSLYSSGIKYVKAVLVLLPSIKKLDGIVVSAGVPIQRTWLCNNEGENLVNQFVEHYFMLYDSNRALLEHTYHQSALFSIMCNKGEGLSQFTDYKLECYQNRSRNILMKSEGVNGIGQIHRCREEIIRFLKSLPETKHDLSTFKIDLIHHESEMSVIMVSGVFKDVQEQSRIRSFNRTFVLHRTGEDQHKIINDLYQVTQASKEEIENSFLASNFSRAKKRKKPIGSIDERQNMVEFVRGFTNMNEKFSRKCLEDVNWNVKKALEVYAQHYKALKIPLEAFSD